MTEKIPDPRSDEFSHLDEGTKRRLEEISKNTDDGNQEFTDNDLLFDIFKQGDHWIEKSTGRRVKIYPMSSWGYGTHGPGSISSYFINKDADSGPMKSFYPSRFVDEFICEKD